MTEPKSTYRRVAKHRAKLSETGGRRLDLLLSPEANAAAEHLIESGVASNLTALINQLLIEKNQNN